MRDSQKSKLYWAERELLTRSPRLESEAELRRFVADVFNDSRVQRHRVWASGRWAVEGQASGEAALLERCLARTRGARAGTGEGAVGINGAQGLNWYRGKQRKAVEVALKLGAEIRCTVLYHATVYPHCVLRRRTAGGWWLFRDLDYGLLGYARPSWITLEDADAPVDTE